MVSNKFKIYNVAQAHKKTALVSQGRFVFAANAFASHTTKALGIIDTRGHKWRIALRRIRLTALGCEKYAIQATVLLLKFQ